MLMANRRARAAARGTTRSSSDGCFQHLNITWLLRLRLCLSFFGIPEKTSGNRQTRVFHGLVFVGSLDVRNFFQGHFCPRTNVNLSPVQHICMKISNVESFDSMWFEVLIQGISIFTCFYFFSLYFYFSALLFHKLLFEGIKFSVFDTSVNKNWYKFGVVS